jgi:hypothetical protein
MPKAKTENSTAAVVRTSTSRRSLVGGGASLLLAAAGIAAAHGATGASLAGAGDDAELIALCDQLVEARIAWYALMMSRHTIEDERRTEPEYERLWQLRVGLMDQIENAPSIATPAGARALARAAIATAERGRDGHWDARHDGEWLALQAAEYLAGAQLEDSLVQLTWVQDTSLQEAQR